MILPDKNIILPHSLLGMGGKILSELKTSHTISSLWDKARQFEELKTFENFVLALDLLFILGLIEFEKGLVRRKVQ